MEIKITDITKTCADVIFLHLLTNFHFHLNSYTLPLPFIGTATDIKLFTTVDNSSDRQGESFKAFRILTFLGGQSMAQKHVLC